MNLLTLLLTATLALGKPLSAHAFCYQSGEMMPCEATKITTPPQAEKRTTLGLYMSPREAHHFINHQMPEALFVDVRTRGEFVYVGHPQGLDAHIPYVELENVAEWDAKNNRYGIAPNSHFIVALAQRLHAKGLDRNAPIVLICRSGDRSAKAADLLAKAGYTRVYTVTEGFEGDLSAANQRDINGWRNNALPWSYRSSAHVAYVPG
jgi:rhodanese-related sulfurtransferase